MNRLGQRVVFLLLGLFIATSAFADTKTWSGAVDNRWSVAGNWTGGLPAAGDRIVFPVTASNRSNTNDLLTATFADVTFLGTDYTLSGNGITLSGGIMNGGSTNGSPNPSNTINLDLTLAAAQSFRGWIGNLTINGKVILGSNTLTVDHSNTTNIAGVISGTGSVISQGSCCGVTTLSGINTFSGTTTLGDGSMQIHGSQAGSAVTVQQASARLGGRGLLGELTTGGEIWPGNVSDTSTGVLTVAKATLNGTSKLNIQLNGTTAGTQYDQLRSQNGVTINGATLNLAAGFTPSVGQTFTIIDNASASATAGTFANLPQGAAIDLSGAKYTINYSGGTGNDVVLTCVEVARTWTGAASALWSNAANWSGGVVPVAGDAIVFPATATVKATTNDLPAGRVFKSITFLGTGYSISGNAIGLTGGIQNGLPGLSNLYNSVGVHLVLSAPQTFDGQMGYLNVSSINIGVHTLTFGSGTMINVGGVISGSGTVRLALITSSCCQQTTMSAGNTYTGETRVEGGYLTINGSQSSSDVNVLASSLPRAVGGRGVVRNLNVAGDVWPGGIQNGNFGIFTASTATFNSGSRLLIDLGGTIAGTSHDQLKVSGISLAADTQLQLNLVAMPTVGQQFRIVENTGTGAVTGTFAALAEGATVTSNAAEFRISYVGGTGNDIVLTCTLSPKVWTGAVNDAWSNSGNWTGGVPVSGDGVLFPQTASNRITNNDLASLNLKSITFLGTGYAINGNPFALTNGLQNGAQYIVNLSNTVNSPMTLVAPQSFRGTQGSLTIGGNISLGANTLTLDSSTTITINSVINGTGGVSVNRSETCCSGQTLAGNNSYSGETRVEKQTLNINGVQPNSDVNVLAGIYSRTYVGGRGTVRSLTTFGDVWPGGVLDNALAGVFRVLGNAAFGLNSGLTVNLLSAVPGTGYDQLQVGGNVALAGNVALNTTLGLGFTPALGQIFVIVDNEGSQPVSGTFLNLSEGAQFNIGPYPFRISYVGKSGNDITLTSLSGDPLNAAPVANPDTYSRAAGSPLTVPAAGVLSNDSDPDGDTLSVISPNLTTNAGGTVTMASNGGFTYTPPTGLAGSDFFTYVISDGKGGTDTAIVTINVNTNTAPVANADSYVVSEDSLLNPAAVSGVLANDTDANSNPLTAVLVTPTTHGAMTLNANGSFTYSPVANYFGADSFTYRANDGQANSAVATVSINVVSVNDAPVATPQSVSTSEDVAKSITLAGTDAEGTSLTFTIATLPTRGTLSGTAPNVVYTPAANTSGADSFTFTVRDGSVTSAPATVTISVAAVNDTPVAIAQTVSTSEDTAKSITLTGTDAEGSALTFTIATLPVRGTLSGTAPNVVYTPAANTSGSDSFTFTVRDGSVTSAPATVTINVAAVNDTPIAIAQTVSASEDTAKSITLTGSDAEGSALTFAIATLPARGTLSGAAPSVVYTPAANTSGADSFTFTVNDGTTPSAPATVTINVAAVNDAPVANVQAVTASEDVAKSIILTGSDADGNPLTFAIVTAPTRGTITTGTGATRTYAPQANYSGPDSFTFTVNDGTATSAAATVTINVVAVNDAPVANPQTVSTNEDVAKSITLTGSDVEGSALTFANGTLPLHGTLTGTGATRVYTPQANYSGPDSFTFTVSDGTAPSAAATVTINVVAVNDAPLANAQSVTATEETAKSITLTGSDPEGSAVTFAIGTVPTRGTLSGTAPNVVYTPQLNFNGTDSFTFTTNDGSLASAAATVTINVAAVNDAPVANAQSVTATEDVAKSITLTGSDIDGNPLTFAIVTAPTRGTITTGTGATRTYTPQANYSGPDSFTFTVSDGSLASAAATVTINVVAVNDAPVANAQSVSTSEDTAKSITLTGSDSEGSALIFANGTLPLHGTLTGTGATRTYTPQANYSGPDSFTFTVSDGSLASPAATVTINVTAVNDAPVATAQSVTTNEDTAKSITLTGSDPEGSTLTFANGTLPLHGTLTGTGATRTYTPQANYSGPDSFTFTVSDGSLVSPAATVTINVTAVNDAPVANALSVSTSEDTAKSITLTGSDPEGSALTFAIVTQPTRGTLSGTAPNVVYTPSANSNGADSFTFTTSDGVLTSAPATVTINVTAVNDAPVATAQSVTTNEDTAKSITLTGSDADGNPLTFAIVTQPTRGTLSGTAPNVVYTPTANSSGADSFTFTTNDGTTVSAAATVTINVVAVNDAPVATAQSVTTNEDTAKSVTLTGSDADGNPLTFAIVTQPTRGTLSGTAPNVVYTPTANSSGADSFTFTTNDGTTVSAAATVTINVVAVNDAPVATAQSVTTNEDTAKSITLTGSDAEGNPLTFAIVTQPTRGTLSGTAPNVVYTPTANSNGADSFTFTTSDGVLTSAPATVTINVTAVNDAPVATAQSVTTNEDTAKSVTLTGSDADGNPLTFAIVTQPTRGTLSGTAPNVVYTPTANSSGTDSFTFTTNDGSLASTAATVTINVVAVNDAPVATAQSVTTNEDTAKSVTLTGSDADGNPLTFAIVTQPTRGTLSGTAPNVVYTPTANSSGTDSFTFTTNDGSLASTAATVTINVVAVNDAPVATAQSVTTNEDTAKSITLAGSDVDGNPLTFAIVTQPTRGTLSGTAPNVVYTPTANSSGADSFTFTTNDGSLASTAATVTINVVAVNDAPVLGSVGNRSINEGVALTFILSGSDVDGDALVYSATNLPAGAVFDAATRQFSWTAGEAQGPGSFNATFSVSDGTVADGETITINVGEVNVAPLLAAIGNRSGNESVALTFTATATDSDLPANDLTFSLDAGAPAGASIDASTGVFSWTPTEAQGPGSFPVTIRVTDNGSPARSHVRPITITINEVNLAPVVADPGVQSVNEKAAMSLPIVASDSDVPANTLSYSLGAGVVAGMAIDATSGVFTWTPTEAQGPASYDVVVIVSDDGAPVKSAQRTIRINVAEVNEAPVLAAIGNKSGAEGSLISFTATATDADLPANTLTFSLITPPAGASMTSSGTFSWTPTEAQGPGTFSFKVRVTDNGTPALFDEEVITVTVGEANSAPVLAPVSSVSTAWNELVQFTASATDADVPADVLTFSLQNAPSGATMSATSGLFSWTPTSSQIGSHTFTVRVTDDGTPASSASVSVTITVTRRRTTLVSSGAFNGQYSDDAGLKATLRDLNSNAAINGREIHFTLGAVNADATTDATGNAAPVVSLTQAPASVSLSATFDGDGLYIGSSDFDTFVVQQEDARGNYTGPMFTSTFCPECSNAVVTLTATVRDIAATSEAAGDLSVGDIRNATLTFVNRDAGGAVLCTAPLGLVDANDLTTATGNCSWNVDLGLAASTQVTVGIVVGGYYVRNAAYENSVVTISKPVNDSITGGGHLIIEAPAGSAAGTIGSKLNFGFDVRFQEGDMNVVSRRDGRVYQIDATDITAVATQPTTGQAVFVAKATITDITETSNPIVIDTNAKLQVNLTDSIDPGSSDTIGITIWDENNALWLSSRWDGTRTTEQALDGGELHIH